MTKKLSVFIIGAILFLTSLPTSTELVMEFIHTRKMSEQYEIVDVREIEETPDSYQPPDSIFNFNGRLIEIKETIKESKSYIDPWGNQIKSADLSLELDGKVLANLKNHPIRVDDIGLNRYYGEVAYITLYDRKNNKNQFIILLKKTKETIREMPNGDLVGWVPEEKLNYLLYAIDEEGNVESDSFSFTERDALQTELLNAGGVVPYYIGFYTNDLKAYPTIFFPLIFPFLTFIIGLILTIVYFPMRKNIKRQSM
ncbi:hypothetical protein ACK1LH_03435 [Metabacillus indicus]|uniref:hypothetical protein n=1 Tax=Metabacillus indicus TaxID=246786 RepID=UPI003983F595